MSIALGSLLAFGQLGLAVVYVQLSRRTWRHERDLVRLMAAVDAMYVGHGMRPPFAEGLGVEVVEVIDAERMPPPSTSTGPSPKGDQ